ncbi:MAG: hypothetical protein H6744_17055 [Deltaproteobacteria bacterium]|nr:hypothetical protein [Deltaproteobacteria bacterium]
MAVADSGGASATDSGGASADPLEELGVLAERITDARSEVAVMSAELQRLHFLTWICRARAVQFRVPDDLRVERAAGEIARTLGTLSKRWWPGSVSALQIRATPLDAGAEMGLPGGGRLHDWLEAAEQAEELLARRLDALGDGRHDDYGWVDQGALSPAPNDPGALLRETLATSERLLGPLGREPSRDVRRRLSGDSGGAVAGELAGVARALRWLRGHTTAPETWAAALGRLRWAVSQLRGDAAGSLRALLDAEYRPPTSWAQTLGQDPERKRLRRRRRDILTTIPGLGDDVDDGALAQWLSEAFELGTELPNPRLAGLLYPMRERILALDAEDLPGSNRRVRKRLADLKKRLSVIGSEEAMSIRRTAEREFDTADRTPEPEPEPTEQAPEAIDLLAARVRRETEGRRALFVSNREDPDLKSRLEALLHLELTWSVIDPRRIQAKRDSVMQGSYDFVLSATGFQGHNVDAALCRAARSAGIPYVRVNRGRPVTCVRSLARELGLDPAQEAA